MRILALDSSGLVASVAIVEDDNLIAEYTVNYKKTHSQTLLPMLDEIVKMTEYDLQTIDAIAVAGGPGSFTGLRIGAATAKKNTVTTPSHDNIKTSSLFQSCFFTYACDFFAFFNFFAPSGRSSPETHGLRRSCNAHSAI